MQKDGSDGENFVFGEFRIDRERQTGLVGDRPAQDMEAGLDASILQTALARVLEFRKRNSAIRVLSPKSGSSLCMRNSRLVLVVFGAALTLYLIRNALEFGHTVKTDYDFWVPAVERLWEQPQ